MMESGRRKKPLSAHLPPHEEGAEECTCRRIWGFAKRHNSKPPLSHTRNAPIISSCPESRIILLPLSMPSPRTVISVLLLLLSRPRRPLANTTLKISKMNIASGSNENKSEEDDFAPDTARELAEDLFDRLSNVERCWVPCVPCLKSAAGRGGRADGVYFNSYD